jgi:succinate dehydrogenase hydrophobic anchor subunit
MTRRTTRRPTGPIEAAISVVFAYLAALLAIAIAVWLLFVWRRPDDSGGAMLYEATHSGFWQAATWLVLVVSLGIVVLGLFRSALRRR